MASRHRRDGAAKAARAAASRTIIDAKHQCPEQCHKDNYLNI